MTQHPPRPESPPGFSKHNRYVIAADEKGYVVEDDGRVRSPIGGHRGVRLGTTGYLQFTVKPEGERSAKSVSVHRLAAYQKFGMAALMPGIHVRHLDGNPHNNRLDNIAIGTPHQNVMDRRPEDRKAHALKAAAAQRKISLEQAAEVRAARARGERTVDVARRFGIAESTVCDIVKGRIYRGDGQAVAGRPPIDLDPVVAEFLRDAGSIVNGDSFSAERLSEFAATIVEMSSKMELRLGA